MTPEHLRRALSIVDASHTGDGIKQLSGRVRALGLVRALEFLNVKAGAGSVARAFAVQLGLGDDLARAVERLEAAPRGERLRIERAAHRLADAVHLASRAQVRGETAAAPALLNATDASRTPLTRGTALAQVAHVGLAATRLLEVSERAEGRSAALSALVDHALPPTGYETAYARWRGFTAPGAERCVAVVEATSWVLCGLGNPSPTENGLALHPTWGVPWLPGTSLKGIARAWLRDRGAPLAEVEDWFGRSPGTDEDDGGQAGAVDFLDAWWVPDARTPWVTDIVTPHHRRYYEHGEAPSGEEDPVPNTFLAARGRFRLVVEGQREWAQPALDLLLQALAERGVGAKTRAGYGRMERREDDPWDRQARQDEETRHAQERKDRLDADQREARRARRAELDPGARAVDVAQDEGVDALRGWFMAGGTTDLVGLLPDEAHARAAYAVLYERHAAAGLVEAPERFGSVARAEVEARQAGGRPTPRRAAGSRHLDLDELERVIERRTRKGKVDFDGVCRDVAKWNLSAADVEVATRLLADKGARPGHLKVLRG